MADNKPDGSKKATKVVYCKYIVKKGKRIYPKNASAFRFEVKV